MNVQHVAEDSIQKGGSCCVRSMNIHWVRKPIDKGEMVEYGMGKPRSKLEGEYISVRTVQCREASHGGC